MRREAWQVALLYSALTLLLAYPLSVNPAGSVLSANPDTQLFIWALSWDTHAFTHRPWSIFDANIYYPQRLTLAYSENFIGSALFAAPILWLTGNPVLALNVVSLFSAVLCGVGAYLLARRIGLSRSGATLAGLIYAFSPPRFLRLGQLHLTAVQWMPFGLAFLHAYLDGGRRVHVRLAAAFLTLQALSSGHGAVYLSLAMAGLLVYRAALGEPLALTRRLRDLGIPGALLLAPTVLIALPYRAVQIEMGLRRSPDDWTSTWSSFLASPAHIQSFLLSLIPAARINENAWAYLFPGFLTLLLALGAVWAFRSAPAADGRPNQPPPRLRRSAEASAKAEGLRYEGPPLISRESRVWTRMAIVLEILSLASLALSVYVTAIGPLRVRVGAVVLFSARQAWRPWLVCAVAVAARIAIARRAPFEILPRVRRTLEAVRNWRRRSRHDALGFYGLLTLLCMWLSAGPPGGLWPLVSSLPGLNFIRVPSRFSLLGMLGLAVLAGAGFERLSARFAPGRRLIAGTLVGALLVAEFAAIPLHTEPYHVVIPPIDRWLDSRPKPFAVAEVPLPGPRDLGAWERRHSSYMLHSMAHWQKTVHGYSGLRPALHEQLYEELLAFPDERSLRHLSELNVDYVVVHTDLYPPGAWTTMDQRLRVFQEWLKLEHVEGAGRVYSLQRPPAGISRNAGHRQGAQK